MMITQGLSFLVIWKLLKEGCKSRSLLLSSFLSDDAVMNTLPGQPKLIAAEIIWRSVPDQRNDAVDKRHIPASESLSAPEEKKWSVESWVLGGLSAVLETERGHMQIQRSSASGAQRVLKGGRPKTADEVIFLHLPHRKTSRDRKEDTNPFEAFQCSSTIWCQLLLPAKQRWEAAWLILWNVNSWIESLWNSCLKSLSPVKLELDSTEGCHTSNVKKWHLQKTLTFRLHIPAEYQY